MKSLVTSNLRRWGRALVAFVLATAALVWLLSVWGGLPAAEARGSVVANTGSTALPLPNTDTFTNFIFFPLVSKSDVVFFDNFSNPSSGWPHGETFEDCYFEYHDGHYRVRVSDYGQRCIVPNFNIPKQINGTFSVKVRRTSREERLMLYGLIFGAGPDATRDRWALEIYPNNDSKCDDKPFYWLSARVDGDDKYFRDTCTDAIDTDEDEWNDLMVIRNGRSIKIYINGRSKGEYNDANYLLNEGYSLLEVISISDETIYVEFDDFTILRSTDAP